MHYKLSDIMPVRCRFILRWLNQCNEAMGMNGEVIVVAVVLSQKWRACGAIDPRQQGMTKSGSCATA
jgi:hypothetical protein